MEFRRNLLKYSLLIVLIIFSGSHLIAYAETYYIDFQNGNDNNSGISQAVAWKTIPGTMTTNGSSWLTSDWGNGTINSSNRVPPGTIFKLKGGTIHDSSNGGYIHINNIFYNEASAGNPIIFELDTSWGTGNVVFDGTGVYANVGLILIRINGIVIDGKLSNGIIVKNSQRSGIQIKEKSGSSDPVNDCVLKYIKFYNNGTLYSSSSEGSGNGQLNVRKANGLMVDNVELDGNSIHINGMVFGDSHKAVVNATVTNSTVYNHVGNDPPNDCGIGFKAFNSQVVYDNCLSYNNLKGWDLGEINGDNRDITYVVTNSISRNNNFGMNMNAAGSASYSGNVKFYMINNILRDNINQGCNIYAGPFDLYMVHNIFDNNGTDTSSGAYKGNVAITSNPDTSKIRAYLYNNIFYKPAGHHNLLVKRSVNSTHDFSLYSDYNAWIEDDQPHLYGQYFCRWSYYVSPAVDFNYGNNGPGHNNGNWYNWYNANSIPPVNGANGHYHADSNSVGTGALVNVEPPFRDISNLDYSLTFSYPGEDLSIMSWYIPEMGKDKNGNSRSTWDMGIYDFGSFSGVLEAPSNLRIK